MKSFKLLYLLAFSVLLHACGTTDYIPKPRGQNHIDLPPHEYVVLDEDDKPYSFEYSKSAVTKAYSYNEGQEFKSLYKTIAYEDFGANIHITYKKIHNSVDTLNSLIDEAFRLAQGHNKKAYAIQDREMMTTSGNRATVIEITGEVPSTYQFFMHDSTNHFLRGVLYFPTATKNDSLAPVIDFVKEDIHHLVNTVKWKG